MPRCEECGAEAPPGRQECEECGAPLARSGVRPARVRQSKAGRRSFWPAVGYLAVGFVLGLLVSSTFSGKSPEGSAQAPQPAATAAGQEAPADPSQVQWIEAHLAALREGVREQVMAQLAKEKCPCACGMTLAECMVKDPSCSHRLDRTQEVIAQALQSQAAARK